jgi:hypothetical protein
MCIKSLLDWLSDIVAFIQLMAKVTINQPEWLFPAGEFYDGSIVIMRRKGLTLRRNRGLQPTVVSPGEALKMILKGVITLLARF